MAMLSHRKPWSAALVLAVIPCVSVAGRSNETPAASFRTGTSEVRIVFFATDQDNHPVETIDRDDFAVVDSGMVIREFRSLERTQETSLHIVVLVDASGSVTPRFHASMENALQVVSRESSTSGDDFSLLSFSGLHPDLLCARDCGTPSAQQKLLAIQSAGATPLFDALVYAAHLISSRHTPGARDVLILFSDGEDTISRSSGEDAVDAVTASGAALYTVDLNEPGTESRGSLVLRRVAEASGGRSFSMQEGAAKVLASILADLRASYIVTYPLPNRTIGSHSLRILPKHNLNLRFHCRRNYFYEEIP